MINRNIKLFMIGLIVIIISPSISLGAVFNELVFNGFSDDGKILAFTVYQREDPGPFVNIYIVNVSSNELVQPVKSYGDEELFGKSYDNTDFDNYEEKIRISAAKMIEPELNKFQIMKGNVGQYVVARRAEEIVPFTDYSVFAVDISYAPQSSHGLNDPFPFALQDKEQLKKQIGRDVYEIVLSTFVAGYHSEFDGVPIKTFKLSITNLITNKEKILQEDKTLPKSRKEHFDYAIKDVYVYRNYIAVFIAYERRTFEDSAVDYLVVTGTLP